MGDTGLELVTRWLRVSCINTNDCKNKDLQQVESSAYKPAYKQNPKTGQNEPIELPSELAEIVAVWPELPGHINAEINALVKTNSSKKAE